MHAHSGSTHILFAHAYYTRSTPHTHTIMRRLRMIVMTNIKPNVVVVVVVDNIPVIIIVYRHVFACRHSNNIGSNVSC